MPKNQIKIADLKPDPENARRHTDRNRELLEQSLKEVGAARSIVIDENGTVLAGNATVAAAMQAGIDKVKIIDADGETIIAVRRNGLTPEQKKRLALFDNRTGELAKWDAQALAALIEQDKTALDGLWNEEELRNLLADTPQYAVQKEYDESIAEGVSLCICAECGHEHSKREK